MPLKFLYFGKNSLNTNTYDQGPGGIPSKSSLESWWHSRKILVQVIFIPTGSWSDSHQEIKFPVPNILAKFCSGISLGSKIAHSQIYIAAENKARFVTGKIDAATNSFANFYKEIHAYQLGHCLPPAIHFIVKISKFGVPYNETELAMEYCETWCIS